MRGRWDDGVAMAAGFAAGISWIWHGMFGIGMVALFLLGVITVFIAMLSITRPGMIAGEAALLGVGALMFCLPWLLGFTDVSAAAWTAWIIGGAIAVMGAIGLPQSSRAHRRLIPH